MVKIPGHAEEICEDIHRRKKAMDENEIQKWKAKIDAMSQEDMARLWRFAPVGHPVFVRDSKLYDYFNDRFQSLGGMTPEISKKLGW